MDKIIFSDNGCHDGLNDVLEELISKYRVRKAGYKILRVNGVVLQHQLGELELKKVGNSVLHVGGHSAFRKYYIAQNTIYISKKHPDVCSKWYCVKKYFC